MRGRTIRTRRVGRLERPSTARQSNARFVRQFLLELRGWKCGGCGCPLSHYPGRSDLPPTAATLDHIQPQSKGGGNSTRKNLQILCCHCNGIKGDYWES